MTLYYINLFIYIYIEFLNKKKMNITKTITFIFTACVIAASSAILLLVGLEENDSIFIKVGVLSLSIFNIVLSVPMLRTYEKHLQLKR